MSESHEENPALGSLAERINYLFASIAPEHGDRPEYTGQEVISWLRQRGYELSASHLSELRRGVKTNPTMRVIDGLARFFAVRVGFLHGDPDAIRDVMAEIRLRRALREAQVTDIAARVAGLDPEQRHAVADFITQIVYEQSTGKDGTPPGRGSSSK